MSVCHRGANTIRRGAAGQAFQAFPRFTLRRRRKVVALGRAQSPDELLVGEPLSEHVPGHGEEPALIAIGVLPLVEPEHLLAQISEKMEGLGAHVCSLDSAFQQ